MHCLLCQYEPIYPEARAGLCTSCEWSVRSHDYQPLADDDGALCLVPCLASPSHPLGYEGSQAPYYLYQPETIYTDPLDAAECREQLFALYNTNQHGNRQSQARATIDAIRATGCQVSIDSQYGRAFLSNPAKLPYPLLLRFVTLTEDVEDELTREYAGTLATLKEKFDALKARFGVKYARDTLQIVHGEHLEDERDLGDTSNGGQEEDGRDIPRIDSEDGAPLRLERLPYVG